MFEKLKNALRNAITKNWKFTLIPALFLCVVFVTTSIYLDQGIKYTIGTALIFFFVPYIGAVAIRVVINFEKQGDASSPETGSEAQSGNTEEGEADEEGETEGERAYRYNENKENKKFYYTVILGFWTGVVFLSLTLPLLVVHFLPIIPYYAAATIVFLFFAVPTLIQGWTETPQNHADMVEILGDFAKIWHGGPHIRIPFFMRVETRVYLGEQIMHMEMTEAAPDQYGFGMVDFIDGSAPVVANVFFLVENPSKATYNVSDVLAGIEEKMDSSIRSYLAGKSIDEANKEKVQMDLACILGGKAFAESFNRLSRTEKQKATNMPDIWKDIYYNWGVWIRSIAITDIVLSDDIIQARQMVLVAERNVEKSKHDAKAKRIMATAQKNELERHGQGIAAQVKQLVDDGMDRSEALNYLQNRLKWEAIKDGQNQKVIIESGSGGAVSSGAQFAAGMSANQNQ